jgi:hypothetical protein
MVGGGVVRFLPFTFHYCFDGVLDLSVRFHV